MNAHWGPKDIRWGERKGSQGKEEEAKSQREKSSQDQREKLSWRNMTEGRWDKVPWRCPDT